MRAIKGNIIEARSFGDFNAVKDGYLLLEEDGTIAGIETKIKDGIPVEDYKDALILESFADMHLHAPQYPMVGMGMDLELMEWLSAYTFPTEAKYKDADFARSVYSVLSKDLIANGTTKVAIFSSLHTDATITLMEELEKAGITGFAGKVNMDRNGSDELIETTDESIEETLRFLKEAERFKYIHPIITPRFTPSCSDRLMEELGKIAKDRNLPVQSHLSENRGEIAFVKELRPDTEEYWESYAKAGLWNDRTLMAHCVWSSEREQEAMRKAGVAMVHCPSSNVNICSGTAKVKRMISNGVKVVLGSDIAGGDTIAMLSVMASAIKASKHVSIETGDKSDILSAREVYFLATSASDFFFDKKPGFGNGKKLDALVLDDSAFVKARELSLEERLERAIYRADTTNIKAVYSEGIRIR